MSDSLQPHGLQHARLLCPTLSPGVCSGSCPLSQWCSLTISSSVAPFFCLQPFSVSGSFSVSPLFILGGQSIGASASVLPKNIQGWFPLGLTGLFSLLSKGLPRVLLLFKSILLHFNFSIFFTTQRNINISFNYIFPLLLFWLTLCRDWATCDYI